MKKRTLILGGIVIVFAVLGIITQVKTRKVEQELKDTSVLIDLVTSYDGLDWDKSNLFLLTDLEIHAMGTRSYCITPVWNGFVTGAIDLGIEKLKHFPEDIWAEYDFGGDGVYYYPGTCESKVDWKDNESLAVSFNRPYTIEEVMEISELSAARWFWIDTCGDEEYIQEGYIPSPGAENCAYGVTCESLSDLWEECKQWVDCVNSYDENTETESGGRIYKLKENISGGETVRLEDIRILGCEIRALGYKREKMRMRNDPMFHIVQSVRSQR